MINLKKSLSSSTPIGMLPLRLALFATFSGFLANAFLPSKAKQPVEPAGSGDLHEALAELERLAADQQGATPVLRSRIAELESPA